MSHLEKTLRQEIRKTKINKIVIGTIATAGVFALALLAPTVLGALDKLGITPSNRKQNVQKSITKLIEGGYVVIKNNRVYLTQKGEKFAALIGVGKLAPKKPKRWDKKWRVLIFDIPETRRKMAYRIRQTLAAIGFVRLQDSVWVYPYDCEDLVTLFKVDQRIGKDLLYIIADKIENDKHVRNIFNLPLS